MDKASQKVNSLVSLRTGRATLSPDCLFIRVPIFASILKREKGREKERDRDRIRTGIATLLDVCIVRLLSSINEFVQLGSVIRQFQLDSGNLVLNLAPSDEQICLLACTLSQPTPCCF